MKALSLELFFCHIRIGVFVIYKMGNDASGVDLLHFTGECFNYTLPD